jgi:hypothetical protein
MGEIRRGLQSGLDVAVYAGPEFNGDQMFQIRRGLEAGVNVSVYAKTVFNANQMFQIRRGLETGVNVSVCAKPVFDANQMFQIRRGLEAGLDVSIYAKPEFDWMQMEQLRRGLEAGVDVSPHARPELGPVEMWEAIEGRKASFPLLERYVREPGEPRNGELGLYGVSNSVGGGAMVVARDEKNAKALAISVGIIKDLKLARCVRYNVEKFLAGEKEPAAAQSLREILAAGEQGVLRRYMPDWMEEEFRAGKREYTCIYGLMPRKAPEKPPQCIATAWKNTKTDTRRRNYWGL